MNTSSARLALGRISFVILIVCGVAMILLNLLLKQSIQRLQTDLDAQTGSRQRAEAALQATQHELASANDRLTTTRDALHQAILARDTALQQARAQSVRAEEADRALAEVGQKLERAQIELARFKTAGLSPEEVTTAARRIKDLEARLSARESENDNLAKKLDSFREHCPHLANLVFLPAGMRAKVVATDPKWNFVVFDAGRDQGVLTRGQLLISRNGTLVGKAIVSRVEKDRAIANVLTGWNLSQVVEGDVVIPADPGT